MIERKSWWRCVYRNDGTSIMSTLVAIGLTAFLGIVVSQTLGNLVLGHSAMQSKIETDYIADTVRMILGSKETCSSSGLVGLTFNPLTPAITSIQLKLPSNSVYSEENQKIPGSNWTVSRLRIDNLTPVSPLFYFATLALDISFRNGSSSIAATSFPGKNRRLLFYIFLTLNASNTVVDCSGKQPTSFVQVQLGADYGVPMNSTVVIPYSNVITDLLGEFSPGTHRFTVKTPGSYAFSGVAYLDTRSCGGIPNGGMSLYLYKNGVLRRGLDGVVQVASVSWTSLSSNFFAVETASAGDYFDLRVYGCISNIGNMPMGNPAGVVNYLSIHMLP